MGPGGFLGRTWKSQSKNNMLPEHILTIAIFFFSILFWTLLFSPSPLTLETTIAVTLGSKFAFPEGLSPVRVNTTFEPLEKPQRVCTTISFSPTMQRLAQETSNYTLQNRCRISIYSILMGSFSDEVLETIDERIFPSEEYSLLDAPEKAQLENLGRICYILFTDEPNVKRISRALSPSSGWKVFSGGLAQSGQHNIRKLTRWPKILPHLFFPDCQYAIQTDFKLGLVVDPRILIRDVLFSGWFSFAAFIHPKLEKYPNGWMYREAKIVSDRHTTADPKLLDEQMERYRSSGLDFSVFIEGSLLFWDLQQPSSLKLSCAWMEEYMNPNNSDRDQPAFAFVYSNMSTSESTSMYNIIPLDHPKYTFGRGERRRRVDRRYTLVFDH